MRIGALAFDYDGTLARQGRVDPATVAALKRAKASGRRLLMVTGRELPDLLQVFADTALFDVIVAENGAVLWRPGLGEARALAAAPPAAFIEALQRAGVSPLSVGRSIVATLRIHEAKVGAAIAALGLDWRVILNNESLMCLPAGADKASGLAAALAELGLDARCVLGVGDAENDLAFLAACGASAAVANALPALRTAADLVTEGEDGEGVVWLVGRLLAGALD
jgi:hydroxymethylpyrimidine pyrophosphatase-like HAD family hydrolase